LENWIFILLTSRSLPGSLLGIFIVGYFFHSFFLSFFLSFSLWKTVFDFDFSI
jgi:hypothetical protein